MTPANVTVKDDTTPRNILDFLLSVLKSFSIDAVSLTLGKGESGCWQSRNWQRGPQPSLTSNTNSLSLGTVFSTSVIHSLKKVVDSSSPFSILSNKSAAMCHPGGIQPLEVQTKCSLVPNITHACTFGESVWLNYLHAWTNVKLLCGKKHTTNYFVSHNPKNTQLQNLFMSKMWFPIQACFFTNFC